MAEKIHSLDKAINNITGKIGIVFLTFYGQSPYHIKEEQKLTNKNSPFSKKSKEWSNIMRKLYLSPAYPYSLCGCVAEK